MRLTALYKGPHHTVYEAHVGKRPLYLLPLIAQRLLVRGKPQQYHERSLGAHHTVRWDSHMGIMAIGSKDACVKAFEDYERLLQDRLSDHVLFDDLDPHGIPHRMSLLGSSTPDMPWMMLGEGWIEHPFDKAVGDIFENHALPWMEIGAYEDLEPLEALWMLSQDERTDMSKDAKNLLSHLLRQTAKKAQHTPVADIVQDPHYQLLRHIKKQNPTFYHHTMAAA